jgi:hypothetical protein
LFVQNVTSAAAIAFQRYNQRIVAEGEMRFDTLREALLRPPWVLGRPFVRKAARECERFLVRARRSIPAGESVRNLRSALKSQAAVATYDRAEAMLSLCRLTQNAESLLLRFDSELKVVRDRVQRTDAIIGAIAVVIALVSMFYGVN